MNRIITNIRHRIISILTVLTILCGMVAAMGPVVLAAPVTPGGGPDITADFLDPYFRDAVRKELGIKPGEPIYADDKSGSISGVTTLNVSGRGITNLSGIEHFPYLSELDCSYNRLTSLDMTGFKGLQILICNDNYLTSLNVNGLTELRELECSSNLLTTLNVKGLSQLETLLCGGNRLTSLDVSGLTNLNMLECMSNRLSELEATGLTSLQYLNCRNNVLTKLNLTGSNYLHNLNCSGNLLTSLNVSSLPLRELCCCHNLLTSLDISGAPPAMLRYVCCKSNQITSITLPQSLTARYVYFDVRYNHISGTYLDTLTAYMSRMGGFINFLSTPQNSNKVEHVIRISEVPLMAVAGEPLLLTGDVLASRAGRIDIDWSVDDWTGGALTWPVIETGKDEKTNFRASVPGIAYVKANITSGTSLGVDYTQYVRIVVAEPLTFTHSEYFDIPLVIPETPIARICVTPGVTGGIPPYSFKSYGLPEGLEIDAQGVISGTVKSQKPGDWADKAIITVTDSRGVSASVAINIDRTGGNNYMIGGKDPGGSALWFADLQALNKAVGYENVRSITLLGNVELGDYADSAGLWVSAGQDMTIDLNGYDLAITGGGTAILVNTGGTLTVNGSGNLDLTRKDNKTPIDCLYADGGTIRQTGGAKIHVIVTNGYGVRAVNSADVTVTSIVAQGGGVRAESGGAVTVTGDISSSANGISAAGDNVIVTVTGNVTSSSTAVDVAGESCIVTVAGDISSVSTGINVTGRDNVITVKGDISVTGAGNTGVSTVHNGSIVYIHGAISAANYITFVHPILGKKDIVAQEPYPDTKLIDGIELYAYTGSITGIANISSVFVELTSIEIPGYTIGGTNPGTGRWYTNLDALLAAVKLVDGDTITLLGDVSNSKQTLFENITVTINLRVHTLSIDSAGTALALNNSTLNVIGMGALIVTSRNDHTILASQSNIEMEDGAGIFVSGTSGVYAVNSSNITVTRIEANASKSQGLYCEDSTVAVQSAIAVYGADAQGVHIAGKAKSTVFVRSIEAISGTGIYAANNNSDVYVNGRITAKIHIILNDTVVEKTPFPSTVRIDGADFHNYCIQEADSSHVYVMVLKTDDESAIPGDANGDGIVDFTDAYLIIRYLSGWSADEIGGDQYDFDISVCDVNRDGEITLADSYYIIRYLSGWPGYVL